jgi:hypothetical protein
VSSDDRTSLTLLSDGSSDRALIPILNWLLQANLNDCAIQSQWADLRLCNKALRNTFEDRVKLCLDLYPCELLFIHRDAEKEAHEIRVSEIRATITQLSSISIPTVCVVPVRMTEAWLLFDILALRKAASNPNGKVALQLPNIKSLENELDPKNVLHQILRQASGLSSRRLRKFSADDCTHRVSELINDFSPLRVLPAFVALETELKNVIKNQGWM